MATEQMAQVFGRVQQLSQQLVHQQENVPTSLECRDNSLKLRWKLSPILALRKLPKRPRDFQTKAFSKEGFKGDEKAWPDWRYKFRVEASRCFRQAAAILDWAEDRHDQSISESDIQQVAATTCSFMVIWSLMEERTEGFESA